MPSPLPSMDPYLESSEWISIHVELSSEIARQRASPAITNEPWRGTTASR